MALTLQQRLGRLQVRLDELTFWRDRAYFDLHGWTCNGVPLDIGQAWPEREGVVTFALSPVTVPDDWPLEDVLLDLNLGGEGLLSVRYTDGSRQALGLDPFHRRFPLCHREFSVEAQTVARYPFGVPNRDARLEWARLVLIDRPLDIFIRRLILLLEAARTLVDQEVAPLLADTGERAVGLLDWPSATEPYLSRVKESAQMLDIWSLPPGLEHHPRGLNEEQRQSVEAANELLERELVAQRASYPHQGRAALTGQAHLDLAWLWPIEETRRKAQRTCSTVLSLMERDPNLTFHLTSAQVYAFLEQDDQTLFARIRESAASGRWEPIGGMWVEPDLNMPAGESLVRQLLYGQRFFERVFGKRHNVAWLPDCFGFTAALPQLLLGRRGLLEPIESHSPQHLGCLGELDVSVVDDLDLVAPRVVDVERSGSLHLKAGLAHGRPCRLLVVDLRHREADVDEDIVAHLQRRVLHQPNVDLALDADHVDQRQLVTVAGQELHDPTGDGEAHG